MSNNEIKIRDALRWSTLSPEPEPEPEPKPELVTWQLCVRIEPWEIVQIVDFMFYAKWYPSGYIPEDWYPIEAQSGPVETVKQLPEGQQP